MTLQPRHSDPPRSPKSEGIPDSLVEYACDVYEQATEEQAFRPHSHLMRAALEAVFVTRTFVCPGCGDVVTVDDDATEVHCVGPKGSGHDVRMVRYYPLREAQTFLASIASAQSQGTRDQTDWMIETAREGLRRSGGHDFDG